MTLFLKCLITFLFQLLTVAKSCNNSVVVADNEILQLGKWKQYNKNKQYMFMYIWHNFKRMCNFSIIVTAFQQIKITLRNLEDILKKKLKRCIDVFWSNTLHRSSFKMASIVVWRSR